MSEAAEPTAGSSTRAGSRVQPEPRSRKAGRPGMSLLDFAAMGQRGRADAPADSRRTQSPSRWSRWKRPQRSTSARPPALPLEAEAAAAEAGTATMEPAESSRIVPAERRAASRPETQQAEARGRRTGRRSRGR